MQELAFRRGMKPGHGINLLTGESLPSIAVIGKLTPIEFALGQNATSKLIRIEDVSTLHKSLGVEVTASGSYMGFSADAKVTFANECNFNSHSTYLLIHIQVTNATVSMDDPILSADAEELLRNKLPDRFRERFGDVYINGVTTGGEYFAIFQISGTDDREKEQLSVVVNASFRAFAGSADLGVKINSMVERSTTHLELKAFNFQSGGSDPSSDLKPEEMMAKARTFALSVRGDFSVPYSMLPASYRSLKIPEDADNPIDIENQRQALADAWKVRNRLATLNNDIEYILFSTVNNHDEFEAFDVVALTDSRNELVRTLDSITEVASACMSDAKKCKFPEFDISAIKVPKRKLREGSLFRVPNVIGLGRLDAGRKIEAAGLRHIDKLPFSAENFGLATQQNPPDGTMVEPRSIVTVSFPSIMGPLDDQGPFPF